MDKPFKIVLLGLTVILFTGCATVDPHYTARPSMYGGPTHVALPSENLGLDLTMSMVDQSTRVLQEDSMIVTFDIVKHPRHYGYNRQDELGRYQCEILLGEAGAPNMIPVECDAVQLKGNTVFVYYTLNGNSTTYALNQARGEYVQNGFCLNRSYSPGQIQRSTVVWATHDNIKPKGFWGALAMGIGCN